MIYIEKGDNVLLPKKYHEAHNISVVCHDLIVEIGKLPKFKDLYRTSLILTKEEQPKISEIDQSGKMLEWLKSTGRGKELNLILSKHLFTAIAADSCNFIYESLSAARRGKMTVAYSLIRKPLTDSLYLLEQLLDNRDEFIDRFYHDGSPRSYDPSHSVKKKEKFVEVIKACVSQINMAGLDSELIYDIRYNKDLPNSLKPMMDKALHIVTNDPRYATEQQNLNFVFSMDEQFHSQWTHYYYYVPYLIIYFSAIVDKIAVTLLGKHGDLIYKRDVRRQIALILWSPGAGKAKVLKAIKGELPSCKKCGPGSLTRSDYAIYFESGLLMCYKCLKVLS